MYSKKKGKYIRGLDNSSYKMDKELRVKKYNSEEIQFLLVKIEEFEQRDGSRAKEMLKHYKTRLKNIKKGIK